MIVLKYRAGICGFSPSSSNKTALYFDLEISLDSSHQSPCLLSSVSKFRKHLDELMQEIFGISDFRLNLLHRESALICLPALLLFIFL